MGLFDRFFGGEEAQATTEVRLAGDLRADHVDVHLGETRFRCRFETNGPWVAATGGATIDEPDHRLFLFHLEEGVRYVMNLSDPQDLTVAGDGSVALADAPQAGTSTFFVLDDRGTVLVEHHLEDPPGPVAVTDDGRYAAVATSGGRASVFGLPEGEVLTEQETDEGASRRLAFREEDGRWTLVLGERGGQPPGAGAEGQVLWRSED